MSSKQPMQASGGDRDAKAPDGVNNAQGDGSTGQAYPNGVKPDKKAAGFFGHGGQTEQSYSGPDGGKANATTE